jgi:predicted esterase
MWNMEWEWECGLLRRWGSRLCLAFAGIVACHRAAETPSLSSTADAQPEARIEDAIAPDAANGDAGLEPIPADPLFTNLTVTGFPEAVVSVPNGATSRRPVVVVLHGSADRPDWNCDAWRHITGAYGFVLCPRGAYVPGESTASDHRFTHRGGTYLRAHVDAALQALQERFGAYVDVEQPVVTGFSLGATEIGQLAVGDPPRFSRVAQLEGGYVVWTPPAISTFVARGGQRVLFGCGSSWCVPLANAAAERLEKAGVVARVVFAKVGHTTDRPLQEALMGELAWFLAGDARWPQAP